MGSLLKDIRYALRILLKKDRVLTIVAILTLGLGIAAPVTWYSVLDKVVFKPLPFDDLDQLIVLNERNAQSGRQLRAMSVGDFMDLRKDSKSYESLSAYEQNDFYLTGMTDPVKIEGTRASANVFHMLGVTAAMGRVFLPDEEQPGHEGGVMPPDFDYPITTRAWIPLALDDQDAANRSERYVTVIGRMKPNVSTDDAQSETNILMKRIEERNPNTNQGRTARVVSLPRQVRGDISGWFSGMCFALSLFVLGLCCVNIMTIQLARGWARQKELSLRAAVGT